MNFEDIVRGTARKSRAAAQKTGTTSELTRRSPKVHRKLQEAVQELGNESGDDPESSRALLVNRDKGDGDLDDSGRDMIVDISLPTERQVTLNDSHEVQYATVHPEPKMASDEQK